MQGGEGCRCHKHSRSGSEAFSHRCEQGASQRDLLRDRVIRDADRDGEDQCVKHRGCGDLRLPQGTGACRPHPGVQSAEGDPGQGSGREEQRPAVDAATGQQVAPAALGQPEPESEPAEVKDGEHEDPRTPKERQGDSQRRGADQQGDGGKGDALGNSGLPGLEGVGVGRGGP